MQLRRARVHLGVTGEDLVREMIPDADQRVVLIERARLRPRQCGGRGAAGLDRRAQHGRSRRRRDRVPPPARPQDAGRDQVRQSHARLLRRARHRRLPHRRELGRDRRRAGRRHGRADRRHHHDRRDARRQRPEDRRRRRDPALAGQSRRLARRRLGRRPSARSRAASSTASPRRRARAPIARCARASPAATTRCWRRPRSGSAWSRRSAGRPRPAC